MLEFINFVFGFRSSHSSLLSLFKHIFNGRTQIMTQFDFLNEGFHVLGPVVLRLGLSSDNIFIQFLFFGVRTGHFETELHNINHTLGVCLSNRVVKSHSGTGFGKANQRFQFSRCHRHRRIIVSP
ncbi:hypothetical protein SAMN05216388_10629 [Halorientalis persicus]|uniref:Uncharacterized protein n=1 Tax=Halorientalis persicus TaxID=1367881 RepID=A0A1H8WK11_9EURY|nr:hypothetical protein SAMN05216388_10629 [Halorientalis persicus]